MFSDFFFWSCCSVSHVQVIGRPLSPAFSVDIIETSGKFALKALSYTQPSLPENGSRPLPDELLEGRVRDLEQIVNLLRGQGVVVEYDWNEEDELDEGMAL